MGRIRTLVVLGVLCSLMLSVGCSWVGETAGRAQAGVEKAISDTQAGYHKGYAQGKR